ncbi:MAG: MerR family transcriptional regulator [Oxalobacteraceae bacterium]|nr:MerR family transcriptional regulator [Oxalobacteraceae bacterium]
MWWPGARKPIRKHCASGTLRVWERRYALVVPGRSDTGRRLYSEADIIKISLVKQLTDAGHPVSALAKLSIDALRQRLNAPGVKGADVLKDSEVKEWLRDTMVSAPTHLSARLLLRATTGQFDKLSAEGTLYAIETLAPTIFTVVQSATPNDLSKLPNDVVQAEIEKLVDSKKHFNTNAIPLLDAVIGYGEVVRSYTEKKAADIGQNADRNRALYMTARGVTDALAKFKAAPQRL